MTDMQKLVPRTKLIYSFREIADFGLITQGLLFKLYRNGEIEVIKLGNRNNVSRNELIRYLEDNRISRTA